MPRLVLILALALAFAPSAAAECAWVLWQETVMNKASRENITRTDDWNMQSAHPTYSECVQAARQAALDARSNSAVVMAFGAPGKLGKTGEQGIYRIDFFPDPRDIHKPEIVGGNLTFQCFPDTTDPRPREQRVWVLWTQVLSDDPAKPARGTWLPQSAEFSTRPECLREITQRRGAYFSERKLDGYTYTMSAYCLPDTVDPRPRTKE